MTHRDEINNMSNEELADFLSSITYEECRYCAYYDGTCVCYHTAECSKGIEEWLNMEAEE